MTEEKKQDMTIGDDGVSELRNIIEAALFVAEQPIGIRKIQAMFEEDAKPSKEQIEEIVANLTERYEQTGLELVRIGQGWRFQTNQKYASWLRKLSAEKPPRYSRAQLETLAIIAYRQPVTRGDIEDVRGVAVSSDIIRLLEERGWIREIGFRDAPGRPALFGTTQEFLSYFNLRSLSELPELIHERQFEEIAKEMNMDIAHQQEQTENSDDEATTAEVIPITQAMQDNQADTDS